MGRSNPTDSPLCNGYANAHDRTSARRKFVIKRDLPVKRPTCRRRPEDVLYENAAPNISAPCSVTSHARFNPRLLARARQLRAAVRHPTGVTQDGAALSVSSFLIGDYLFGFSAGLTRRKADRLEMLWSGLRRSASASVFGSRPLRVLPPAFSGTSEPESLHR